MDIDTLHTLLLICGGKGYERDVSLSGMKNILPLIDEKRFRVISAEITKNGEWLTDGKIILLTNGGIILDGELVKIDCAFPLLHGDFGEDGRVQGALDCADIPYIGCDAVSGAICRDKFVVKAVATSLNIPTLPSVLLTKGENRQIAIAKIEKQIGYPAFVKPTSLGSSYGVSIAKCRRQLIHALKNALSFSDRVLVEKALTDKRELECGFLSVKGKELFTNPGEIIIDGTYDYDKKYLPGVTKTKVNAELDEKVTAKIKKYSKLLVQALGVRDFSRIDYFLSGEELYFNEINTIPGMTDTSLYPRMIEEAGVSFKEALNMLIEERILVE